MKHIILGTSGHVDHGKTALVRALTGIECDTHREERERGITIHLGFAHYQLPSGERIGIVDVPGHRDFIHTMLGGASGIDAVLLVIAADSGVMPQTREHMKIMELLGVTQGLVVITKVDLVPEELLEICELDVRDFLAGSFLAEAPLLKVSAKTGRGIDELRAALGRRVDQVAERPAAGIFRLPIDRSFSVSGFGTVVTGTVLGGTLRRDDTVYLQGINPKPLRVRRLECYGAEVAAIQAGDRAALNLAGLDRTDVQRGLVLADRILRATSLVDATLALHAPETELGIWSQAVFLAGTAERQVRVHLLDRNRLGTGETALVQLHLQEPLPLQPGDRFVVRNSSCDVTLGGGQVLDASPLHHRRRPVRLIESLTRLIGSPLPELVALELRRARRPLTAKEIAANLNLDQEEVARAVASSPAKTLVPFDTKEGLVLVSRSYLDNLGRLLVAAARDFRKRNPLARQGIDLEELRGLLHLDRRPAHDEVVLATLGQLVEKEKLKEVGRTWLLASDSGAIDETVLRQIAAIEEYLRSCGMQTPLLSQIALVADREGVAEKDLRTILHHLTTLGKVVKIEDSYIHRTVVDSCRQRLVEYLLGHDEGIRVSDFRDLVDGNRKICLLLLARFDEERLTYRKGDLRFLSTAARSAALAAKG